MLYDALPEPSVKKMEHVVSTAMDIVFVLSATVSCCFTFKNFQKYYKLTGGICSDIEISGHNIVQSF